MASLNASAVASWIASDNVGWGWIVFNSSVNVDSKFLAIDTSVIRFVAFLPIIWHPNNSPYFESYIF